MWRIEIGVRLRIGREPAKQSESASEHSTSSDIFESQGAMVERSDAPVAATSPPIGFHPAPEDARRSATSRTTQQHEH